LDDTRVLITISQYAATRGAGAHEILGVFVNNGNQRKRRSRWKLADSAIEKAEKIKKIEKKEREKERERERERDEDDIAARVRSRFEPRRAGDFNVNLPRCRL